MPWAKPVAFAGAGCSSSTEEDSKEVDKDNNIPNITINTAFSVIEPGSSSEAVKDNPGKDILIHFTNHPLTGHEQAGVRGQEQDAALGGGHDHHEGGDQLCPEGVHSQIDVGLVQGQLQQTGGGVHGHAERKDGGEDCEQHCGGAADDQGQHLHVTGGVQVPEGGTGGGVVHDEDRGVDSIGGCSLTFRLRYPTDDMSPKMRKPRRRKIQDKLKQATIKFKSQENQNESFSSNVGLFVPSGGPWEIMVTGRGCKRGIEDQMEGPVDKKRRNERICPNLLDSDCNF